MHLRLTRPVNDITDSAKSMNDFIMEIILLASDNKGKFWCCFGYKKSYVKINVIWKYDKLQINFQKKWDFIKCKPR